MGMDWSKIVCLLEVSAMLYKCTYYFFNLHGSKAIISGPNFLGTLACLEVGASRAINKLFCSLENISILFGPYKFGFSGKIDKPAKESVFMPNANYTYYKHDKCATINKTVSRKFEQTTTVFGS